jgi:Domain of unknown function (DUF1905)/Bacteriocin-protection, YdeI or OmpD-Associated
MKTYRFRVKIESADAGGAYVEFPYDVEKEFGARGRVPVKVAFDGVPYTGSLVKCGASMYIVGVLKSICQQIGKTPGDTVEVELSRDETERRVDVPEDFAAALKREKLRSAFDKLSFTHQREYVGWITEAKRAATRSARLEKAAAMLRDGVKTPG